MQAFFAWLIGVFSKELVNFAYAKIKDYLDKAKATQEANAKEADQSASDMQKAKDLKPDASAKDVSDAISDASSHF